MTSIGRRIFHHNLVEGDGDVPFDLGRLDGVYRIIMIKWLTMKSETSSLSVRVTDAAIDVAAVASKSFESS